MKRELAFEVSARNIYKKIEYLCTQYPARFAGSKDDNEAAEYINQNFSECGLDVSTEEYEIPCFEEIESELSIFIPYSKYKRPIPCMPQWFAPSTPFNGVTAELVDVGYGDEHGFKEKDISGKIPIFKKPPNVWALISDQMCRASRNGAKALIMINDKPWCFRGSIETGCFDLDKRLPKETLIPTIVIPSGDGDYILQILNKQPLTASLKVRVDVDERKIKIVKGIHQGELYPSQRVVVCAHRDTIGGPGADDNASGTSILLELARILSKYKMKRTIEFLSTTAEEMYSIGAWAYIQKHKAELKKIIGLINIDNVGFSEGPPRVVTAGKWRDITLHHSDWINQLLLKAAESLGYLMEPIFGDFATPDEGRFIHAGVEAAWIWKDHTPGNPFYHSFLESPNRLCPNDLKSIADITIVTLWEIANENISSLKKL